jgi:RNA polymerase sigma-70 factor (ECF subfamily)
LDETELVGAARSGDRQAFDELVRRTFVDTFTLARRLAGNEEDARDVVQEAYLRARKGIGKFRGEAAFSTWLYRITANAAASNLQRRRRQRAVPFDDDFEPVDTNAEQMVSKGAESAEALDRISADLDELTAKLRSVVVLKDVYVMSHESIA